ncbi:MULTISPECIES: carbohydrate ABC transporter permease [unclassified Schaalia]|uniref:carbohydrate ABC transporter permease n=1 Tax=unclassified Schaalia TaxID=2691889 RepID=UPI001E5A9847|nr:MULTISPECIES: carbohydrate ABC transporter permease [unclassified Schaalia]MCD4550058.1 carbohydrate ABC transporter permease [Schaalia sp. lx-260]MCD4557875.1 carbohydrate ABC transporter permease [Schaalia sp. lx-100]
MLSAAEKRRKRNAWLKSGVAWVLAAIYLFPVYWMVSTSLKNTAETFAQPPHIIPHALHFDSYKAAFSPEYGVWLALGNSFIIATGTLVLTLVIAVPASYAVARFRDAVSTSMMVLLTVVQLLPAIAISIPMFVMFRQMDLINTYASIIIADVSVTLPFAVILLRPYFKQFPYEVEEAAKLDGLGVIQTIIRIIIPTIRPGVVMIGSFAFLMAWGEFTFALTLSTQQEIQPLTVALNRLIGQYGTNWNDLMAVATIIAVPVLLIFIALQRYIVAGLAGGATKG